MVENSAALQEKFLAVSDGFVEKARNAQGALLKIIKGHLHIDPQHAVTWDPVLYNLSNKEDALDVRAIAQPNVGYAPLWGEEVKLVVEINGANIAAVFGLKVLEDPVWEESMIWQRGLFVEHFVVELIQSLYLIRDD